MARLNPRLKQRQKRGARILFGSPDRVISTISLAVGSLGLLLSAFAFAYPANVPPILFLRDITLLIFLVLTIVVLAIKYYKKAELVEDFRLLLENQLVSTHRLIDKFRERFFTDIRYFLISGDNSQQEAEDTREHFFKGVCHSVLFDTRKLFQDYFEARGFEIGDDISVTLKLKVSHEEAQKLSDAIKGNQADKLTPNCSYIVTAYRDPFTWEERPQRREPMEVPYKVEDNTSFDQIINKNFDRFVCDDLSTLYAVGKYKNSHDNWQQLYNSCLVVPVRHFSQKNHQSSTLYGVLAIDSLNTKGHDLFSNEITYHMLAHSADILAIMLGSIDIIQNRTTRLR